MICCLQTCLNWWNFKYLHILQLRRYSRAYWAWWPLFSWVGKVWLPLFHFCTNSQYKITIKVGIYVRIYLQNQNLKLDSTANMRWEYNQLAHRWWQFSSQGIPFFIKGTGFAAYICKNYILDECTECPFELQYCTFHYSSEHNFWANSFTTAIFWK